MAAVAAVVTTGMAAAAVAVGAENATTDRD
jgi:hypothetical protein